MPWGPPVGEFSAWRRDSVAFHEHAGVALVLLAGHVVAGEGRWETPRGWNHGSPSI